jgi:hypothetical protein
MNVVRLKGFKIPLGSLKKRIAIRLRSDRLLAEFAHYLGDRMKTQNKHCFLICPVRNADTKQAEAVVRQLEENGWKVHWPHRDTDQKDNIGLRICEDNFKAIRDADIVFIIWDGKSQGCLFDAGMAFALNKRIVCFDLPQITPEKSFQNMFLEWEKKTGNSCVECGGDGINPITGFNTPAELCSTCNGDGINPEVGFAVSASLFKANMNIKNHAQRIKIESKLKKI